MTFCESFVFTLTTELRGSRGDVHHKQEKEGDLEEKIFVFRKHFTNREKFRFTITIGVHINRGDYRPQVRTLLGMIHNYSLHRSTAKCFQIKGN